MRLFQKVLQELKDVVLSHRPGDMLAPPPSLPFMEIDGRRLSYISAGEEQPGRPPVVLLHGFGGFFMDWPRVMAPIARQTRVYALDLPGWGFSDPNLDARSMEADVDVVEKFMKQLGLKDVILCGLSYGAGVAWAAASMHLPRIQRVVLLNPLPLYPQKHIKSLIYQGIFTANMFEGISNVGHRFLTKGQYKIICRENLINDRLLDTFYLDLAYMVIKQPKIPFMLRAHAFGARSVPWHEWEHRLAGVTMPVTILQGREDRIFSMGSALALHRLMPTSELIEVDDCGHAMVFDQHRKVSDFIIKCLDNGQARGGEKNELVEKDLLKRLA